MTTLVTWRKLIAVFLLIAGCATAEGAAAVYARAEARELRVIAEAFPTIATISPDGKMSGVGVEVLQAIADKLHMKLTLSVIPWGRSLELMRQGQADILIGPYPTPERAQYMDFSEAAIYRAKVAFYAPAGKGIDWQGDYATLRGKRIGTTLAWWYGAKFENERKTLTLDPTVRQPDSFRMLLHDRIDLLITTESAAQAAIDQLGLAGQVEELSPPVDVLEGHIGFGKTAELKAIRLEFDKALAELVADGTIARINQKYGRFY